MNEFIGVIGAVVAVLSLVYAVYANRRHTKLVNYNREQAWEIYRQITKVLGHYQDLEKLTIDDKVAIKHIAKGESFTQELIVNSIRMIKRFEKKFDSETIDKWHKEGKLPNESYVKTFKSYV